MTDEHGGFATARARLEQIATQVKDRDTSLEKALDLLEEGVRIANRCTELLDHTAWREAVSEEEEAAVALDAEGGESAAADAQEPARASDSDDAEVVAAEAADEGVDASDDEELRGPEDEPEGPDAEDERTEPL